MESKTNTIASKLLGKNVKGSDLYNPAFLVSVPRIENRQQYNIFENDLPFCGYDIWHAYEFSTMTQNGLPVTRLMKMKYSCQSKYIVESKSLKLYLNSFNMTKNGKNTQECLNISKKIIEKDLSDCLKTEVEINFLENDIKVFKVFDDFKNLLKLTDENALKIEKFKESPSLLEFAQTSKEQTYKLYFDALRSNCRVTHQPDFGDVFIYYKSKKHILEDSLIKYLCSFRSEFHFHEECCEMIFKRLYDILDKNDGLFVCILYTRRGGIDICPVRYSKNCEFSDYTNLTDTLKLVRHGIKQ